MSNKFSLGRIVVIDERDKNFPISTLLEESVDEMVDLPRRFWWSDGWWGNQGSMPSCVAFAWMHFLEDGPVIQDDADRSSGKPFFNTKEFYDLCQKHDKFRGENYDGTTVRAGAKILNHLGVIKSYRWAYSIDDVIKTVKYIGPMVVGTDWFLNMSNPDKNGKIYATGRNLGGHSYVINGLDDEQRLLRIKNSWGRGWGKEGYAYISYDDFSMLLTNGGEACIAFENKMSSVPELILD